LEKWAFLAKSSKKVHFQGIPRNSSKIGFNRWILRDFLKVGGCSTPPKNGVFGHFKEVEIISTSQKLNPFPLLFLL